MHKEERVSTGLLTATQELRELIIANPDLPLLVFAGQDASSPDFGYTSCFRVNASIGEYLDCMQTVNDEHCYTDRDEFEEDLEHRGGLDFSHWVCKAKRFIFDRTAINFPRPFCSLFELKKEDKHV